MPNVTLIDRLDGVNEGVAAKAPCRVATTAAITLSGLQAIDGVTVAEGNRVLVKDQTDATANGIYDASAGTWVRAYDCNGNRDIVKGSKIFVNEGSSYIRTVWVVTSTDPITIDEDDIDFLQWAGGGGGFPNVTYWTVGDEEGSLPNSRMSAAGAGITLTDGGAGSTITVAASVNLRTSTAIFIIDGAGSTITTGIKGDIQLHAAYTIQSVTLLADQSGSIVVDIWKDSYANYPPTDADSITASAVPTISSATKSTDATLTGWTTSITAGDTLRFNVDSVTTLTRVTVALKLLKTS